MMKTMYIAHLAREWSNPLPIVVVWTDYYDHLTIAQIGVYYTYEKERGIYNE